MVQSRSNGTACTRAVALSRHFAIIMLTTSALSSCPAAHAQSWLPASAFVQADASSHTDAAVGGLIWPLKLDYSFSHGKITSYAEASLGRWHSRTDGMGSSTAWVSQFGITPVFRYQPDEASRWFLEAGIGPISSRRFTEAEAKDSARFSTSATTSA
jgi:hypothetical protein